MSNIIVDYNAPIQDGTEVVFRSPVDCSQITGLKVNYIGGSKEFMLADAHGNNVGDIDHLFAENVVVKVILDVDNGMAFVQNPDTNSYLEYRFGMLADSIANEASGSTITLKDATNRKLQGLKIYGTEETASAESVTVNITGKNLVDYRKSIPRKSGHTVTIDESINGVRWTGDFFFYIPLDVIIPKGTTIRFSCKSEPEDSSKDDFIKAINVYYTDGTDGYTQMAEPFTLSKDVNQISVRRNTSGNSYTLKVWDMQLEIGRTTTEYEPYKFQTITVPTPNGLQSGEVLEVPEASNLSTYKPTTRITNDCGAEMAVEYVADTKTFILNEIKKEFTELQNAILSSGANV